jgi:hypothetical protein
MYSVYLKKKSGRHAAQAPALRERFHFSRVHVKSVLEIDKSDIVDWLIS